VIVGLPPGLARAQAALMEVLDMLSLGLLPNEFKLTRDQVALLGRDNVVSAQALAEVARWRGSGSADRL
jgi:NADH dehydrogenase